MTEPEAIPYKIAYSGRVRDDLKALLRQQVAAGVGPATLSVIKAIDYRLRVYPQFGEILHDLQTEGQSRWIATVPPLVVDYIIDEVNRTVFVIAPLKVL